MSEPTGTQRGSTLWHGRFAEGPAEALMAYTAEHRVRPAALARRHRRLAGPRQGTRPRRAAERSRARRGARRARRRRTPRWSRARSSSCRPTRTSTPPSSGGSPSWPARPGAKLHTARSRNDQVATDLRLWCKRELRLVAERVVDLQRVLLARAEADQTTALPGYTHLQRAQPVLLAHHLLAHGWALSRDVDRLLATVERLDVSPLGAGRAGRHVVADRPRVHRAELGFARPFDNSLDAVSDRDFVAEALFDLALIGVHLARLGEEWVLWTSEEFGFARLDDRYATGSSMLPQKKNPDIAELARGKSGRLIGNLTGLLTTLKGLPLAYNRDLQEDKEPLFDSVEQVSLALIALAGMIETATFVPERMEAAADAETNSATDLAEWLVRAGTPFRDAHAIVGEVVRDHLATGNVARRAGAGRRAPRPRRGRARRARRRRASVARRPALAARCARRSAGGVPQTQSTADGDAGIGDGAMTFPGTRSRSATASATCRASCSTRTTSPTPTTRSLQWFMAALPADAMYVARQRRRARSTSW